MKKSAIILLAGILAVSMFAGCGKKKETPQISSAEPEIAGSVEEEIDPHEGETQSYLTGEWLGADVIQKRPLAVMTGNSGGALPQYGISEADVIYEGLMEGCETRLMAIYSNQSYENAEKIMSVRSSRLYFIDWALEFDAMYSHYGYAKYAKKMLSKDYVHNLDGVDGAVERVMYQRDPSRKAPHNAFTTGEGILAGIEEKGYPTDYSEDYKGHYLFNTDDENEIQLTDGQDAVVVDPGYRVGKGWFVYDSDSGLYKRFQYGEAQIDANNDQQLEVKNILIQACGVREIDAKYGYLEIDTIDSGEGLYITNGKAIPVTWTKESQMEPTKYFDADGNEIILNRGKTWVCIIDKDSKFTFDVSLYASEEEYDAAH